MDPLNPVSLIINKTGTFLDSYTCFTLPPKVNSPGLAKYLIDKSFNLMSYTLPTLEVLMVLVFVVYQGLHFVFKRIGLPPLISRFATGLILNPAVLPEKVSNVLFPKGSIQNLVICGSLGYQMFMFQSGIKMELGLLKTIQGKVFFIGVLCILLPLLVGVTATLVIMKNVKFTNTLFTITTCCISSLPVVVSLLNDLKLLNSKLGRLGVSTALVSDLVSFVLLTVSFSFKPTGQELEEAGHDLKVMLVFILAVALILRPVLKFLARKAFDHLYLKELYVHIIIAIYLGSSFLSHLNGLAVLYGPFIIGLAVPSGPPLGTAVLEKFEAMTGYITAVFVATCGMRVDLAGTGFDTGRLVLGLISLALAILVKFLICYTLHLFFWKSRGKVAAIAFALIMIAKGDVDLAIFSFLNDNQAINDRAFIVLVGSVMVFGSLVPILVRRLYDPAKEYIGFQSRNLVDSSSNARLHIVSCIHAPGDVNAVINLLDVSSSGDSPIAVTVLHHVKLLGQSTPIFISHRRQRIVICDYPHSTNVIRLFNEFEQHNHGFISVNAVTAVSLPKFMYDDIWTVAGESMASLIVLPFHIRWWKQDGSIQSEDQTLRELNNRVLEKAPCSVGILADRCNNRWSIDRNGAQTTLKAAMIFLGGNDDREALFFAIRIAQDTRVKLCVIHFVAMDNEGRIILDDSNELETEQDNVALNDARKTRYITVKEEMVDGAAKTASLIKSMPREYELIIVGRRNNLKDNNIPQTAGLEDWCEYPELGLIGDLILSADTIRKCSLLVVQQAQRE